LTIVGTASNHGCFGYDAPSIEVVIWAHEKDNHFVLGTFRPAAAAGLLLPISCNKKMIRASF
jgi:hypothetical protein